MLNTIPVLAVFTLIINAVAAQSRDYPIQPIPFTQVNITDDFWLPRLKTTIEVTIPYH